MWQALEAGSKFKNKALALGVPVLDEAGIVGGIAAI
jgi:hypothetical protein